MEHLSKVQKTRYTYYLTLKKYIVELYHEGYNLEPMISRDKILKKIGEKEFELLNDYTDDDLYKARLIKKVNKERFKYQISLSANFCKDFDIEKGQSIAITYDRDTNKIILKLI